MVYLTISTGLGAGVVVDGKVLSGNAGEVGHMTVDPDRRMRCECGSPGHWEAYCSGVNLPTYARWLHGSMDLETSLPMDGSLSAAQIFEAVPRDQLANTVVKRFSRWNVIGLANTIHAYAPSYVALGGAVVMNNQERVLQPIRERLPDQLMISSPDIGVSELGEEAVVKRALAVAAETTADSR